MQRPKPRKAPQQGAIVRTERRWRQHAWRILALWVVVLAAYSNSFRAGLVFDSAGLLLQDARIRAATAQNIGRILTGQYWSSSMAAGLYRPFTTLSYLFNYAVLGNGTSPAGYHWVNLALHGANVALVYLLGILLLEDAAAALAIAAVWGLHPLLTESVTNVVGRADLLAAFGVLAGLLCHVKGAAAPGRRKIVWLAGLVAACVVGLFSKESAAVLPGIMLLYDLTWVRRAAWRQRASAYALLVLPFAGYFYLRSQLHAHLLVRFGDNPLLGAGFWTARLTAVKVIGKFLWLFLWPAHLSADYSYNAVPLFGWPPTAWEDAKALIALGVCLGAGLAAARWYRTRKPLFFFLAFFFVAFSPVSNLVVLIGSIMAERFIYLPSVGLAACLVLAIRAFGAKLSPRWPPAARTAWAATGLVCLAFAVQTYARNFDWYDERSLWTSAVDACPGSFKAHTNLGNALLETPGRLLDAITEYEVALRIKPDEAEGHNNLGNALAEIPGRLPEAISEYQAALRIDPNYTAAHNNLGNALARMPGRLQDAISEYRSALAIEPNYAAAHNNLGSALAEIPGRLEDAISEHEAALRIDPDNAEAHFNLGNALAQVPGRLPQAITEYRAALRIKPDSAEIHCNLGVALAKEDKLPEAIAEYAAALRIAPGLATAHYNLGSALQRIPGRLSEAIAEYEAGLRIRPDPAVQQLVDRLRAGLR
jgi:tetratricopeptide (TPR) repeat protein